MISVIKHIVSLIVCMYCFSCFFAYYSQKKSLLIVLCVTIIDNWNYHIKAYN